MKKGSDTKKPRPVRDWPFGRNAIKTPTWPALDVLPMLKTAILSIPMAWSLRAGAETYKWALPDGGMVYQQMPCGEAAKPMDLNIKDTGTGGPTFETAAMVRFESCSGSFWAIFLG